MHQHILGRNVRVTENVKKHISDKMFKIKHYSDKIIDASIICEHIHNDYIVEITLIFGKKIFYIKHIDNDLYIAIDALFAKVEREVIKLKEKTQEHRVKEAHTKSESAHEYDVDIETIFHKPIVDIVEGVMQCKLLGKHYFVYYPIKKTDDMYKVKVGSTPIFLFKSGDDDSYIEIARDDEEYYDDTWSEIEIKLVANHIVEKKKSEYELVEHNASKAIEHLILDKSRNYIVYINSITNYPECIYKESDTKFKIIKVLDF